MSFIFSTSVQAAQILSADESVNVPQSARFIQSDEFVQVSLTNQINSVHFVTF